MGDQPVASLALLSSPSPPSDLPNNRPRPTPSLPASSTAVPAHRNYEQASSCCDPPGEVLALSTLNTSTTHQPCVKSSPSTSVRPVASSVTPAGSSTLSSTVSAQMDASNCPLASTSPDPSTLTSSPTSSTRSELANTDPSSTPRPSSPARRTPPTTTPAVTTPSARS